jgi:hypothetical protein
MLKLNLDKIKENNIMEDNKIKFITNESDDWSILQCGDFKTCNHQISKEEWVELLRYLGHEVDYKEISDEDMQELM